MQDVRHLKIVLSFVCILGTEVASVCFSKKGIGLFHFFLYSGKPSFYSGKSTFSGCENQNLKEATHPDFVFFSKQLV